MLLRRHKIAITYILVVIIKTAAPLTDGCVEDFDKSSCRITAVCQDYVEENSFPSDFREECYNHMRNDNVPTAVVYKAMSVNYEEIPELRNYFNLVRIFSLDISNNGYTSIPRLAEMNNLKYLNVSNNSISTAVLSSAHAYSYLEEIDCSHNLIDRLEFNEDQYPFSSVLKLNISHNYLTDINEAIFRSLTDLKCLDVSYNYISYVNELTFNGLSTNLEYLNLAHNKITELNGSLLSFTQLQNLFLNNNKITHLSIDDFKYMNNLQHLDCSDNLISAIDKDTFGHMFRLKSISLESNLINSLDKGVFSNTSLENIDISFNKIKAIPRFLFKNKNLTHFNIQQNNLQGDISRGTFVGLSYVSELNLSYQSVHTINDYAFFGLDNLKELYLDNNKITNISLKAFGFLKYLKRLDLSNNRITNLKFEMIDLASLDYLTVSNNRIEIIKRDDLRGLELLQFLDVSYNNITKIEPESFSGLNELAFFNISGNPLTNELESNTFYGLNLVPILDLTQTALTKINNETFNHMFSLRTLNISHSALSEIYFNAFIGTSNIEVLDLSYNLLKYFYINGTQLANIRDLYLNHNLMTEISSVPFLNMKKLNTINLSSNNIDKLNEVIFNYCRNISSLDLSSNRNIKFNISVIDSLHRLEVLSISNISEHITIRKTSKLSVTELYMSANNVTNASSLGINRIPTLNILDLSNNKIENIEGEVFSNLSRLYYLDLSYNDIKFIQTGVFQDNSNLNLLNISHNHLVTVSYGVLYGLTHLNTLDLSYNEIQDLQSERFNDIPTLRILIIDHNNIRKVTFEDFLGRNIKILSLGGNPIPCDLIQNLKASFEELVVITAVNPSRTKINTDGITCADHAATHSSNSDTSVESVNILDDIRNLLMNITLEKSLDDQKTRNTIDDRLKDLVVGNNKTNGLLERYLAMGSRYTNTTVKATAMKYNDSSETTNTDYNSPNTLQNFETTISMKNDTLLSTLNNTIVALINKALNDTSDRRNSPLFMEICTGLILLILLCFVMYKVYKSVILMPRHSLSLSQQIVVPLDDSHRL